ncbi:MAG: metallophosphoesterase [Clostridium sp.]|nr:metallophosphoesterase [Clostridium sp.]
MRTLFLLRGAPGSGKSSWIKQSGLEPYTLSADNIRLMFQSPVMDLDGNLTISQKNDNQTWKTLMELLTLRMSRGEFCIVDATHYKSELIARYKNLVSKYRYRSYVVDFTKVPLDTALERNRLRESYKFVPEEAIRKMYAIFESESGKGEVISGFDVISPEQAIEMTKKDLKFDFNKYKKIVVFGDIHGCFEPLRTYFEANPIKDDNCYIFVGDYIDRGIQNREVLEFLCSIKDRKNVLLLTGNHDPRIAKYTQEGYTKQRLADYLDAKMYQNLLDYVTSPCAFSRTIKGMVKSLFEFSPRGYKTVFNDIVRKKIVGIAKYNKVKIVEPYSPEFINSTIPQIENMDKKELSRLAQRFAQFAYFEFNGKVYLITHGGLPNIPTIFTATEEFIKGVGKYEDTEEVYTAWLKNTPENYIQIHGHRNVFKYPTKVNKRIYNLCSSVEYGDDLRAVEITKRGISVLSIPNPIHAEKPEVTIKKSKVITKTKNELIQELNADKFVDKKVLEDDVISYNFSRKAFERGIWNRITVRARGLFIDSLTDDVVARGFSKFFNLNEVEETDTKTLSHTLTYPLIGYKKENGFLGLVGWHKRLNKPFIASKSTNVGEYADMVREQFNKLNNKDVILAFAKKNNVTFIFEVIDKRDPHIIKYNENKIVLLDIVYNDLEDKFFDYDSMCYVAKSYGIEYKQKELEFNDWESFYKFKKKQDESYDCKHEGWVFVDASGFMFKYKSRFYKFWKMMRSVKDSLSVGRNVKKIFSSEYEVKVYNLMKKKSPEKLASMSIIDIEDEFYKNIKNNY